jgi:hypothetical protein
MPIGTCPACGGAKVDAEGSQCWGCNGHGFVEITSDPEAGVVVRGGRCVDRGTNKPGDPATPRAFRAGYPKILLFDWHRRDSIEETLPGAFQKLPAEIINVRPGEVKAAIGKMTDAAVVACVLVVSREALEASTFPRVSQACSGELSKRKEFRLFVHLSGISRQDLMSAADSKPAAADLLDSVHIGESSEQERFDNLLESIENHLCLLPEILDYLKYERWKRLAAGFGSLLNFGFIAALVVASWRLATNTEATVKSSQFPWIMAMAGALMYLSFLSVCSLGSNLRGGTLLRWGMALSPLWVVWLVHSSKLDMHWRFVIVGFAAGFFLDACRRGWSMMQREQIPISPSRDSIQDTAALAGKWRWRMLATAPVLGSSCRVFISYSRASSWGSSTAASLHAALKAAGVSSFLDAEEIAEGTSWRHKLQEAIGKATVFVSVQDQLTAARYWPSAELHAAIQSQAYCSLPSIVVLCDPTAREQVQTKSQTTTLDALLAQKSQVEPSLLRFIEFKADTPRHFAQGLLNYTPPSVMNPELGALFVTLLVPIRIFCGVLGNVGPAVAVIGMVAWCVTRLWGIKIEDWVLIHRLGTAWMLLAGYCAGFIIPIAFGYRFELRNAKPELVFRAYLATVLMLLWLEKGFVVRETPLAVLSAVIFGGLGFLASCDVVSTSLPSFRNYRKSPV